MKIRNIVVSIALLCLTATMPQRVSAQAEGQLAFGQDQITTAEVGIRNNCSAAHTYELTVGPETKWAKIAGARSITVPPKTTGLVAMEFTTVGLEPGTYLGEVHRFCVDCATACTPVRSIIPLRMRVNWSRAELTGLALAAYVPGEVLVTLSGELKDAEPIVEKLEKEFQLKRLKDVQLSSISKVLVLFRSKPKNLLPELILKLQRHLQVESVQPNFIYRGSNAQTGDSESSQYGPRLIRADRAARYSTGKGIRIALIDTGVDEHEDLKDRVIERANFTDDKDYRQDIHGTIIAGIISANPHNGFGINGIAPDASIISIKVLKQASASDSTATTSNSFAAVQGLLFAIRKKANVANLSFGAPRRDSIMADTVMAAVRGGMVVVAAAGNSGPQGRPDYPAALDGVIAVSAVGRDKMPYASGTVGDYIDLTAPGIGIHSTWPGNAFRDSKGSSEAAAHVTGVVALLLEKKPNASPIEIKNLLERTSTDLGPKGKDNVFGSGLVNACKALEELINSGGICSN